MTEDKDWFAIKNVNIGRNKGFRLRSFVHTCAALALAILGQNNLHAEEELLTVDAKINGKPVVLAFDTGAESTVLFRVQAENMGLRFDGPSTKTKLHAGEVGVGQTEPVDLTLWDNTVKFRFGVIDFPTEFHSEIGGLLSWSNFRNKIIHIDAANRRLEFLDKVPTAATKWSRFPLRKNSDFLTVSLPDSMTGKKYVLLDTGGQSKGVALSPAKWNQWIVSHRNDPRTLSAYYMPGSGIVVNEVFWADELSLGHLKLTKVSVERDDYTGNSASGPRGLATLGLVALKRLDLIVDGKQGYIYIKQNEVVIPPQHNRMGAVFAPETMDKDDLIAHVTDDGPAYEAGIRDGDNYCSRLTLPMQPFGDPTPIGGGCELLNNHREPRRFSN